MKVTDSKEGNSFSHMGLLQKVKTSKADVCQNGGKDRFGTEHYSDGMAHRCEHKFWDCSLKHVQVTVGKSKGIAEEEGKGPWMSEPVLHQPVFLLHS